MVLIRCDFGVLAGCRGTAPGSLRRLAGAAGRWNGVEGWYTGSLLGQGMCGDCFGPLTHRERSHPSIVVWDGCNECRVKMGTATDIYATFVMTVVAQEDKTRAVW